MAVPFSAKDLATDKPQFYINRRNVFNYGPCNQPNTSAKDHVKSRVKMYGLPNSIVSRISLRIFQPFKCNFCSLTVADDVTVSQQPAQK